MRDVAILMTAFNRRETTLRCLRQLARTNVNADVYLVDDGSTDGTSGAILSEFPQVKLIDGDGSLYWNRGMNLAWRHAARHPYRYFVWLNDDVVLRDGCFEELFNCACETKDNAIISGIIDSHDRERVLYGAADEGKNLLAPNGSMQPVLNMNGNVVLIPKSVFNILGNLDPTFHHDLGDVDYGFRARLRGIPVLTTRMVVGSCDYNNYCRVRRYGSNVLDRFRRLYSPLGSDPVINFYFRRRHYGLLNAAAYYLHLHFINLLPDVVVDRLFGNRYSS